MCYYNGQKVSRSELIRLLELEKEAARYDFLNSPLQDGFTYSPTAVLKPNKTRDNFDIIQMEWGFLPSYLKTREEVNKFRYGYKDVNGKWVKAYTTLNTRSETLFTNEKGNVSMFASSARERRCLVLSTGFFEWQEIYPANKRTGLPLKTPVKYPYYIGLKDKSYFWMAGIWQPWTDKETGETVETVSILTTKANFLMTQIHNSKLRMPTILDDELAWEWMMGDLSDERILEIASIQFSDSKMLAHTVAKDFKTQTEPTTAYVYQELPPLLLNENE